MEAIHHIYQIILDFKSSVQFSFSLSALLGKNCHWFIKVEMFFYYGDRELNSLCSTYMFGVIKQIDGVFARLCSLGIFFQNPL